jgi:hypothetical protein
MFDVDAVALGIVIVDIIDHNILVGWQCPPLDICCVQVILTSFNELTASGIDVCSHC